MMPRILKDPLPGAFQILILGGDVILMQMQIQRKDFLQILLFRFPDHV
jgi:hypothetical protein